MPSLLILGTRGIPARYGGFETFAEHLALHLVSRGWNVTVYCQGNGRGAMHEEVWRGVSLVTIPVGGGGAAATARFDWHCIRDALRRPGLVLTLGYNTAVFCAALRMRGKVNVINMDGLEWKRAKWGVLHKAWLYANERLACLLGDHLIADNPEIQAHLRTRVRAEKISFIPYGAEGVAGGDPALLHPLGVAAHRYVSLIARLEPENSILEIVRAFSRRKRGHDLLVLGSFDPDGNAYHRKVKAAASSEVKLLGAIYDEGLVSSIRFFSRAYVHGHQVGGTNPSLVEALGAGCAVMAHDNRFNRWVAGTAGRYFRTEDECAALFDTLLDDDHSIEKMRAASRVRHAQAFTWGQVFSDYEALLRAWCERLGARVTQQLRPADEGAESDT